MHIQLLIKYQEADDDFQSYGLTIGLDTTLGNQSLSPYIIMSKTDAQHDADSFSLMLGVGGFFTVEKDILLVMVILIQILKQIRMHQTEQQMNLMQLGMVILLVMI